MKKGGGGKEGGIKGEEVRKKREGKKDKNEQWIAAEGRYGLK